MRLEIVLRYRGALRPRRRRTSRAASSARGASEHGPEECFQSVRVRQRSQMPAASMTAGGSRGAARRRPAARNPGAAEERRDDALVLLRLARAGGVHEAAAWRDDFGGVPQHRQLRGGERRQIGLAVAATGYPDRAAACRGPSRARRRRRSRTGRRTAAAAAGRPARGARCGRRSPRPSCRGAPSADSGRRTRREGRRSSRQRAPLSCPRATRTRPARDRRAHRRPAVRRAATLRPARRTSPSDSPFPRSGWPPVTINPSGANRVVRTCTPSAASRSQQLVSRSSKRVDRAASAAPAGC